MFDVELVEISKSFGSVLAVDAFSLRVRRGEFLTLLGPSGCGKTTVLKIIAGLEEPSAGQVVIRGEVVNQRPPYARDISLMFQSYALFPHKTVFDNIAFGLKYRAVSRQEREAQVKEILELVRLPGIGHRYPRQLSGGQQQRVALARALVVRPAVLLLDEPLSNLDQKLREGMRVELKQIQETAGITFVFVTHDQEEALTLSDRIVVINAGRSVQVGTPEEVYERPCSKFVAQFLGKSNFLEGRVVDEPGSGAVFVSDSGVRLRVPASDRSTRRERNTVQIRSERIAVALEDGPADKNCLPGRVERLVYEGDHLQYHVRLKSGDVMIASEPATGKSRLDKHSEVWLVFDVVDCNLLAT